MWLVSISRNANKFLNKISKEDKNRISQFIYNLKDWPNVELFYDIKKLQGFKNMYRCRIGVYRITFTIYKKEIKISVEDVSHRKDAYKK